MEKASIVGIVRLVVNYLETQYRQQYSKKQQIKFSLRQMITAVTEGVESIMGLLRLEVCYVQTQDRQQSTAKSNRGRAQYAR